ncbi:MAG: hypothetical protein ABI120_10845 [Gemmatimonadaceae bacterium]
MNARTLPNISLIALIASCFIQIGAQLFAILVIVRTVVTAPPRSFAIFQGEYGYDSGFFWETVPPITLLLFVIALASNWKNPRRNLLIVAFTLFLLGGAVAGIFLEPEFAKLMSLGYSDVVDPALQSRAATWYAYDFGVWFLALFAGMLLLVALARPVIAWPPPHTKERLG